jgi:hypothetical protein
MSTLLKKYCFNTLIEVLWVSNKWVREIVSRPTQSRDRLVEWETLSVEGFTLRRLAFLVEEVSPLRRWGNMYGPGICSHNSFTGTYFWLFRVVYRDSLTGVSDTVDTIAGKMGLIGKQNIT